MKYGRFAAIAAFFTLLPMGAWAADEASKPIQDFDIPTIEKLGQQIYAQDQEAWKATDILLAHHSQQQLKDQKAHGWIVDSLPGRDVVRFVRDGAVGPELFYDVTFAGNTAPVALESKDRTLTPEELAQYNAQLLAIKNIEKPCAEKYNTVALKDPQQVGWLVWAIPATSDSSVVIIGGAVRYTISADGTTILRKDALARSCGLLPKSTPADAKEVGLMWTHLVSLTPVETQVFASLNYAIAVHIETTDGRTWTVSQGHISPVDMDSPGMSGFAARTLAGQMEECSAIVDKSGDGKGGFVISKDAPQVILATEKEEKINVPAPNGSRVAELMCARLDIVPAPNDYKVVRSGYSLSIMDRGTGHPRRMGTLELAAGQFAFSLHEGDPPLTEDLKARVAARLAAFQQAAGKKP